MLRMLWNTLRRQVRLVLILGAVGVLGVVTYVVGMGHDGLPVATGSAQVSASANSSKAWGDAVLANINRYVVPMLPISVANACGLGASSCFRCHNGRAEKPDDKPWHKQHDPVDYSCAGCHKGNPRLMIKKLSHSELIVNPIKHPGESCSGCHTSSDTQKFADRYMKIFSKNKKGE